MADTTYWDLILEQDFNRGISTAERKAPGGGTHIGNQINLSSFAVGSKYWTVTWNPASIANGAEEAKEITVTGAALGDFVIPSFSLDVADLTLTAQVTAANTVTAQLTNNTGAAVDLAEGTLAVLVFNARA